MKKRDEIFNLISVVKVFDIDYITDEDCNRISGLNGDNPVDASRAIKMLALEEFSTYLPYERLKLVEILRKCLADENEDFSRLFSEIEMAFDDEVENKRTHASLTQRTRTLCCP